MKFPAAEFFMGIVFGIILPLSDMFSDGYLFYNTMNFKGDSTAMAACRSCYNEAESYKHRTEQSECNVCASDRLSNTGGINCGQYPAALDKMTELLKDHSCLQNSTVWRIQSLGQKNITFGKTRNLI